jgi:2-methylisocitrate lyase-like PEP mutase family enzyme
MTSEPARQAMRELLSTRSGSGPLILPGAPDALGARVIETLGFEATYITGAGVTNARLGVPDLGLITLTELADTVEAVREAVTIPIVVDADTGFGGPLNVRRTVQALERRGANAIQLEDQQFPKRCGHFAGKEVIPAAEMVAKLHAALDARGNDALLIIARTDARQMLGLEAALERAELYREAGADVIFVEAPESRDELAEIGRRLDGPLLVNIVEGGATPQLPADELGALGFSIVLYANAGLRGALHGMQLVLEHLRRTGSTLGALDQMIGWEQRQELVGKPFFDELSERYATPPHEEVSHE